MKRLLSVTATILVLAGAIAALRRFVVQPWQCNLLLARATQQITAIDQFAGQSLRVTEVARQAMDDMRMCVEREPGNVGAEMALAAAYRTLGRNAEAVGAYETALQYDRRPELYLNLGQAQLAAGQTEEAIHNLTLACMYFPDYEDEIGQYHDEVKHQVDLFQVEILRKLKENERR